MVDHPGEVHPEEPGERRERQEDRGHDRESLLYLVGIGLGHALHEELVECVVAHILIASLHITLKRLAPAAA